MKLLAFTGEEIEPHQAWIWTRLEETLENCEVCIREYYKGKIWLVNDLRESYDDDEVDRFGKMLDEWDIKRVARHLDRATYVLNGLSPQERTISALDRSSMLAIFEALSAMPVLNSEETLRASFDEPFRLVQTNRKLKILDYVPAATQFLFDSSPERRNWAVYSWSKFPRPPTTSEFDWAIKAPLLSALARASVQPVQAELVERLWQGLFLITRRLTKEQITHNLRALDIDPCRLSVDHLAIVTPGLRSLLSTVQILLEKSPGDFWDAMQTISPQAIIEQIFYNPQYDTFLLESRDSEPYEKSALKDMLSWMDPFMSSLKDAHRPQACRFLVYQLLTRLQEQKFPDLARYHAFRAGLSVLISTLRSFTDHESSRGSVASIVLSETLEVISEHIELFLDPPTFDVAGSQREITSLCMDVVRNTLALECQSLKFDYEAILRDGTLQHGVSTYTSKIWDAVVKHLHEDNLQLSTAALIGILPLVGLEKFPTKGDHNKEKTHFNVIYGHLTHLACQILERLADFKPEHLDQLFQNQDTNGSLVSALFSADLDTYQAAVDLVKTISGQSGRKEAISHLLLSFPAVTMHGFSWSFRRISNMKSFGPAPRILRTGTDIIEVLCDSQTGILRTRKLAERKEALLLQKLWEYLWLALTTIFCQTEQWHRMGNDKSVMVEFCRDSIQFADLLFDQFPVFASAIADADPSQKSSARSTLVKSPSTTMNGMVKWLRLRDEYLATTIVGLVSKILRRLGDLKAPVGSEALSYIESVALTSTTKTILTFNEKAELTRALEAYHGKPLVAPAPPPKKQSRITAFAKPVDSSAASSPSVTTPNEEDEYGGVPDEYLMQLSGSVELNKARLASQQQKRVLPKAPPLRPAQPAASVLSFREKREREREAKKKRDQLELARLKKNLPALGIREHTATQGSGLESLNFAITDEKPVDSMMVSSGSSSESESDEDDGVLGRKAASKPDAVRAYEESRKKLKQRMPVKKIKVARSAKDMRARLAPDLSLLHKTLLGWDFFATGDLPPNSGRTDYSLVSSTFSNALEYQKTFEPLLILEAWQGFQAAKEDSSFRSYELKVANRLTVDAFVEVSTVMPPNEVKELGLGEADVILLSKSSKPGSDSKTPHCLARIAKISRRRGVVEVSYRVNPTSGMVNAITPGATLYGIRITSLTPLEREYGALMALPYYDLSDEVIKAKPSPILNYSVDTVKGIVDTYQLNLAQGKAVKSAMDNDAFTLIQGYVLPILRTGVRC
jgi:senataxin